MKKEITNYSGQYDANFTVVFGKHSNRIRRLKGDIFVSNTNQFQGCLLTIFPELKDLSEDEIERAK